MRFDLHVHTTISPCSALSIEDILNKSPEKGLNGICITDHDTMQIRHHIREGLQPNGLCIVFGMEYATTDGDFLLFCPGDEIPPSLPAWEILRWVNDAGGVAIAAHPFRRTRATQEYLIREGFCRIVEAFNGRNTWDENERVREWRGRYPIQEVAGSDAHSLNELGRMVTRFEEPVRSRTDLIAALKSGACLPEFPV